MKISEIFWNVVCKLLAISFRIQCHKDFYMLLNFLVLNMFHNNRYNSFENWLSVTPVDSVPITSPLSIDCCLPPHQPVVPFMFGGVMTRVRPK